ncbi:hypothetical protein PINS_up003032 [Pythium insidiosum]|nr:hypothetical protein PINS_up003032 [Pythium insidiosum]
MLSRSVAPCAVRPATRAFFAPSASAMAQLSVAEEFPGVPRATPAARPAPQLTTSVSSSGLKLASDTSDALVATLGVEIAAGSRVESDANAGASQLLAKMAFRATTARSDLRLFRDIEALGGVVHKAAGRDFVRYNISVLPDAVEAAAEILAETTLAPRFAHWDVAIQKNQVRVEAEQIAACAERTVFENVHAAAFYDDATLGRPVVTAENLAALDEDALAAFYEQYATTASLALVGAGVDHSTLTNIANAHFADVATAAKAPAHAAAHYVGGESRVKRATRNTYVALGFETAGAASAQFGASRVLQGLLQHRLGVKHASAFLSTFEDVGLVGLAGRAAHAETGALVNAFVAEIKKAASAPASAEELAAAKKLVALEAAAALSSRQGRMQVLGAAALQQRAPASPLAVVEGVSAQDVQQLAQKALASRPSLAAVGQLSNLPHIDAVERLLK